MVQVVVRDTMGGVHIFTRTDVPVFGLASFPFSSVVAWGEPEAPVATEAEVAPARASARSG